MTEEKRWGESRRREKKREKREKGREIGIEEKRKEKKRKEDKRRKIGYWDTDRDWGSNSISYNY